MENSSTSKTTTRTQYPEHGAQGQRLIGDVAESKGNGDAVHTVIFERERLCVGLHDLDVACRPFINEPIATHFEHGGVDIRENHLALGPYQAGEFCGEIAGATSNIENGLPGPGSAELDREPLPQTMNPPGHQVVHQVIAAGYRVKDAAHHACLGFPIYPGEAKIRGVVVAIRVAGRLVIHYSHSAVTPVVFRRAGKCT